MDKLDSDEFNKLDKVYQPLQLIRVSKRDNVAIGVYGSPIKKIIIKTLYEPNSKMYMIDEKTGDYILIEAYMLQILNSNGFLPKLIDHYHNETESKLIVEYLDDPWVVAKSFIYELFSTDKEKLSFVYNMIKAVKTLHRFGIYHLDIKPSNIMVHKFDKSVVLIDLEYVHYEKDPSNIEPKSVNIYGTSGYHSPEALNDVEYKVKPDQIFVLGIVIYEVYAKKHLFATDQDTLKKQRFSFRDIPFLVGDLVKKCVQKKPEDRISFDNILDHECFQ